MPSVTQQSTPPRFWPLTRHAGTHYNNYSWLHQEWPLDSSASFFRLYPSGRRVRTNHVGLTVLTWTDTNTINTVQRLMKGFIWILQKSKGTLIASVNSEFLSSADLMLVKRRSCSVFATLQSSRKFIIPTAKRSSNPSEYCRVTEIASNAWRFTAWSDNLAGIAGGE